MYNFEAAGAGVADEIWAWFSARRAIDEAIEALEAAGAGFVPLIADSDWQAKGVRALHVLLGELSERAAAEIAQLRTRQWELEAVGG